MAIFRCKMCGGNLEVLEGTSFCTCEFCGTPQTIPTAVDEGLQALFNRANILRMKSEFDKAADIYEKILQRSEEQSEAYWGLILCKYGIEYVEDPTTFRRIPTCHRASYDAVISDEDYKNALKYADATQRTIYEAEAKLIDEIQKGIISLAQKNDPYDVFICYKETDENGKRTQDSVIANDIYHQLTMEGFKVFYAAITLEDKLGIEYEPYIFSALNTAKVMLSIGTKPEYFNAVWVKNEWARFLKIMKKDRSKLLIPCYREMDPYELPEEFAHLQAQDMSKIGFINDLVRGINKIIRKDSGIEKIKENIAMQQNGLNTSITSINAQVKRGNIALEDGEWEKAEAFFEESLNVDPECAEAYIGKLLVKKQQPNWEALVKMFEGQYKEANVEWMEACPVATEHIDNIIRQYTVKGYLEANEISTLYDFDRRYTSAVSYGKNQKDKLLKEIESERLLMRARQYATDELKKQIEEGIDRVIASLDQYIANAEVKAKDNVAYVKKTYSEHIIEADKKVQELYANALERCEGEYQRLVGLMGNTSNISGYENIIDSLKKIIGYKDTNELVEKCYKEIKYLEEAKRIEEEKKAKELEKRNKRNKKIALVCIALVSVFLVATFITNEVIIPKRKYNVAVSYMQSKNYKEAINAFEEMEGYRDSYEKVIDCKYEQAKWYLESKEYMLAVNILRDIEPYKDSSKLIEDNMILYAKDLMEDKQYKEAIEIFEENENVYEEARILRQEASYYYAIELSEKENYEESLNYFDKAFKFADTQDKKIEIKYKYACQLLENDEPQRALALFENCSGYLDADEKINDAKYRYVILNKDKETKAAFSNETAIPFNSVVYEYLKQLKAIGYPNAKELYDEYYKYHYDIIRQDEEYSWFSIREKH